MNNLFSNIDALFSTAQFSELQIQIAARPIRIAMYNRILNVITSDNIRRPSGYKICVSDDNINYVFYIYQYDQLNTAERKLLKK